MKQHLKKFHGSKDEVGHYLVLNVAFKAQALMKKSQKEAIQPRLKRGSSKVGKQQSTLAESIARGQKRMLPTADEQIADQVMIYVYHKTSLPKNFFEDAAVQASRRRLLGGAEPAILHEGSVAQYVFAELELFFKCLHRIVAETHAFLGKEPGAQLQSDGVTLVNRQKHQSISMTLHFRGKTYTISIGMPHCPSGKSEDVKKKIDGVVVRSLDKTVDEFFASAIQDAAASKLPTLWTGEESALESIRNGIEDAADGEPGGLQSNTCGLHLLTKPGEFTAERSRSRKKQDFEKCISGHAAYASVIGLCNHFAYGEDRLQLLKECQQKAGCPEKTPPRALNGTRLTTIHDACRTMVPMAKGLAIYFQEAVTRGKMDDNTARRLSPDTEQWDNNSVLESIVGLSTHSARICQHENKPLRAVYQLLLIQATTEKPIDLSLIDWRKVARGEFSRFLVKVADLEGAQLEMFTTWWKEQTRLDGLDTIEKWRLGAMQIDPRTKMFGNNAIGGKAAILSAQNISDGVEYLILRHVAHQKKRFEEALLLNKAPPVATASDPPPPASANVTIQSTGFSAEDLAPAFGGGAAAAQEGAPSNDGSAAIDLARLMYGFQAAETTAKAESWDTEQQEKAMKNARASFEVFEKLQTQFDYDKYTSAEDKAKMDKWGVGTPFAGKPKVLKLEDTIPANVDQWMYDLANSSADPDIVVWARLGISLITGCMSSAHVERVNSIAKHILNDKRTRLGDDELEAVTICRMNKDFIRQCRAWFPDVYA